MSGLGLPINPLPSVGELAPFPAGPTVDNLLDAATELGKIPDDALLAGERFTLTILYGGIRSITERHRLAQA